MYYNYEYRNYVSRNKIIIRGDLEGIRNRSSMSYWSMLASSFHLRVNSSNNSKSSGLPSVLRTI